ncbi:hypothetical protein LTR08_001489 [Meristemomyces frigidus]|nr:hypothetical protein LTR08_001489 [Meristemomyces frigidus]
MASSILNVRLDMLKVDDDFITISIDKDTQKYKVQRALLTSASPWFETALGERFQEGQTRTLRFPGTSPDVVQAFIHWLFYRNLNAVFPCDRMQTNDVQTAYVQMTSVRLWIFGQEHLLPKLQNGAMRVLHDNITWAVLHLATLKEAYQGSPECSVLRKRVMREYVMDYQDCSPEFEADELDDFASVPGFFYDYGLETWKRKRVEGEGEKYHGVEAYLIDEETYER